MKGHQYGVFSYFPDAILQGNQLWPGEMSAVFSGCYIRKGGIDYMNVFLTVSITSILPLCSGTLPYGYLSNTVTSLLWPLVFAGYTFPNKKPPLMLISFIIHQTHYEKSDWSRAFNQFTIACELDMINAISAADIAFIMSSSMSAWLPSPLECSPQKQNG